KLLEIGLLLPIIVHAVLGVYIGMKAKHNVGTLSNRANWAYLLQRISGMILLVFIAVHVWTTRFADIPSEDMFRHMEGILTNNLYFAGYVLGVLAAAFHLGNGLWGFCIAWGLVTGQKSQDMVWKAGMGIAAAVAFMGI